MELPIPSRARVASLAGFEDRGRLLFYSNEEQILTVTFRWKPDGTYTGKVALTVGGQTTTATIRIISDERGRWTRAISVSALGKYTVARQHGKARSSFNNRSAVYRLNPHVVLYEEHSPALLSQAIRLYRGRRGGRQSFPAFLLTGVNAELTLELKDRVVRTVRAGTIEFRRFSCCLPGVEMTLWADARHRLCMLELPAQASVFVRAGYESLRTNPVKDPLLSQPSYQFKIQRNVKVPMRDGVVLATDLYMPLGGPERLPLILIRTPYKKEMEELKASYFTRRGYVVAVQDVRGRSSSAGEWDPYRYERKDGFDAVEYLARQPYCSGKIGMIGESYSAWTQWWAAVERPSHLVTIIPNVSPPDPYEIHYQHGTFFLAPVIAWVDLVESHALSDISGAALQKFTEKKYEVLLRNLPVIDLDKAVMGREVSYWRSWIAHPSNDSYWRSVGISQRLHRIRLPVFHQSGWFDHGAIGTKLNYLRMVSHGLPHQKLIMGPWGHTDTAHRSAAGRDFGPEAVLDLRAAYLRWFDYWLKGIDNGVTIELPVSVFVIGANRWIHTDRYPLPGTRFHKWYLAPKGRLSRHLTKRNSHDRYLYDPANPTPNIFVAESSGGVPSNGRPRRLQDRASLNRPDVLVYTSKPLQKAYTFAGPISAVLYASSSAVDTDWHVWLAEVDRTGIRFQLTHGTVRARYRKTTSVPSLLNPFRIYRYVLDLSHMAIRLAAGSRLRVEIASCSFPTCSRSLNTGGHNETETELLSAEQRIYCGRSFPSHIVAPAISMAGTTRPHSLGLVPGDRGPVALHAQ